MTAVAPALTSFPPNTRWSSNGGGYGGSVSSEDVSRMFNTAPRKTAQRQNSSSSIASTNSSSTILPLPLAVNASTPPPAEPASWTARKKAARALWPPGKAEAATGINTTARPQTVSLAASGPTASSAISALHVPMLPSQQMTNGVGQAHAIMRDSSPPAILHLVPMNGTFERKTITVPFAPDILRIGRQTNQKTLPTPTNGYFDSKVLSRQHAELHADRQGRVFIRDVKSSNGTFVNGIRLSSENKESEPRELREGDQLELGIDIVSEDQKTVVHHKVAAKVEHAGIYGQGGDALNFGDLDPTAGPGLLGGAHPLKRTGSQGSVIGRGPLNPVGTQAGVNGAILTQPSHMRNWLNPITTEHVVKKLNAEMRLAMQQSQEIARARQAIEFMLGEKMQSPNRDPKPNFERSRPASLKAKLDSKPQFPEPPAPPPQAPLPEKPDIARALADPVIQPLLRRSETARPPSAGSSPTRTDHSSDIIRLCEELKLARGELSNQGERMKHLEVELARERTARESAEERAQRLEDGDRQDSPTKDGVQVGEKKAATGGGSAGGSPDLETQLERLRASMEEMKHQLDSYRTRAENAEAERDEAHKSLAEMVAEKRKENGDVGAKSPLSRPISRSRRSSNKHTLPLSSKSGHDLNGKAVMPAHVTTAATPERLLEQAGIEQGQPITQEQAKIITQFLAQEVLSSQRGLQTSDGLMYYGLPYGSFAAVLLLGYFAMTWVNGWPKVER